MSSHFDRKQFNSLIEGDTELFLTLLQLFEEDWPRIMSSLDKAISQKNLKQIEQMAHRIKGNLRNFYAIDAAAVALAIEEAGRENKLNGIEEQVAQLKIAIEQVQKDLRDFYKEVTANKKS